MINPEKLDYYLVSRDNTEMLKGVIPESLRFEVRKNKNTYCMIACDDENAYGICVFYVLDEIVFIKHIEVSGDVINQGIGRYLLYCVLGLVQHYGASVAQVKIGEDETDAITFFEKCGFLKNGFYLETYFKLKDMGECEIFSAYKRRQDRQEKKVNQSAFMKDGVLRLECVKSAEIMRYADYLDKEDMFHYFINPNIDRHLSMVYIENGKIVGCILIGSCKDGLIIEYANTEKILNKEIVLNMMYKAYTSATECYPADTIVYVMTINDNAQSLITKLVPNPDNQVKRYMLNIYLGEVTAKN